MLPLFTQSFSDYIDGLHREALSEASERYPGHHATEDELAAAARPQRTHAPIPPTLAPGREAVTIMPHNGRLRIAIAVVGDANLLALRPPNSKPIEEDFPGGTIENGFVVTVIPDVSARHGAVERAVEQFRREVEHGARCLADAIRLWYQPVGRALQKFSDVQAEGRAQEKRDAEARFNLAHSGYRVA